MVVGQAALGGATKGARREATPVRRLLELVEANSMNLLEARFVNPARDRIKRIRARAVFFAFAHRHCACHFELFREHRDSINVTFTEKEVAAGYAVGRHPPLGVGESGLTVASPCAPVVHRRN